MEHLFYTNERNTRNTRDKWKAQYLISESIFMKYHNKIVQPLGKIGPTCLLGEFDWISNQMDNRREN